MFVGGLPQQPQPPLNYQIVYSLEGVLDYYTTLSWVAPRRQAHSRCGRCPSASPCDFGGRLDELEAFHTAGGLSTMPFRYEGKIPSMEYKTLRYPGHAHIMEAIRDLGLLSLDPIDVKGTKVVPRDVVVATIGPKLKKPEGRDLVALRVIVAGTKNGAPRTLCWELIDRYDEQHGISAMMRTTGYSLSITGQMQAKGEIAPPGVHTPTSAYRQNATSTNSPSAAFGSGRATRERAYRTDKDGRRREIRRVRSLNLSSILTRFVLLIS